MKKILITGGTGTFGQAFIENVFNHKDTNTHISIYSRDELKQSTLARRHKNLVDSGRLSFIIGDVRDLQCLENTFINTMPDYVIHAAAMKRIEVCQNNPGQAVQTNVIGSRNVINTAKAFNVRNLVAISTDKAVKPINTYGTTKKLMEDMTLNAGYCVVRYGNVVGSRGSVIPLWLDQVERGEPLVLRGLTATRFLLPVKDAIRTVIDNLDNRGLVIPKDMKAASMRDVARVISARAELLLHAPLEYEKLHEDITDTENSELAHKYTNEELRDIIQEVRDAR